MLWAVALSRHAAGKGRRGRAVCQDIAEEWDVSIDAKAGARRNVVAQGIMSNPTAALRACEWEWQPQATENKHTEKGGVERQLRGCGARCEYPGSKWAGL